MKTNNIRKACALCLGIAVSFSIAVGISSNKTTNEVTAATTKTLTFDLSRNPGGWPTANSTTLTDYTYSLEDVDYTFSLKNVKCNSGYLMLTQPAALGLPALENYKLTKVVATNSSGCSTSTKVGISYSDQSADYLSGGDLRQWSTQGSEYTYEVEDTTSNTSYFLYVTSKNAQITSLSLTYEATSYTPSVDVTGVSLDKTSLSLEVGDTATLTETVLPSDATDKSVSWSTGNAAVATVDDGVVTAVGEGSTTITVTTTDQSRTATCDVTVTKATKTKVTYKFSEHSFTNDAAVGDFKINDDLSGNTDGKYFTSGASLRVYSNNSLTISCSSAYLIKEIQLGLASSSSGTNPITTSCETYDATNFRWTGSSTAVTFQVGGTSGHRRIETLTISYAENTEPAFAITDSVINGNVGATGTINYETSNMTDPVITFTSDDEDIVTVTNTGAYSLVGIGSTRINGVATYQSQDYEASVVAHVSGETTIANAIALGANFNNGDTSLYKVTLTGEVTNYVAPTSSSGHFDLSDGANSIYVYGIYSSTANVDQLANGVTVTITGNLNIYSNQLQIKNTVIESVVRPDVNVESVSLDQQEATVKVGKTFQLTATVLPENASDISVSWESDDTDVATVSSTGVVTGVAAGEATITVTTTDGNKTATCVVTVIESPVLPEGTQFKKITSTSEFGVGKYLVAYEKVENVDNVDTTSYYVFNGKDTANGNVAGNVNAKGNLLFTSTMSVLNVETMDGGYSLQLEYGNTDTEGKYISGTSGSNALNFNATAQLNTVTIADGLATITSNTSVLRYNTDSNGNRFRYYKSSSTSYPLPSLYKMVEEENDPIQGWIDSYMKMGDPNFAGNGTGACKDEGLYLAAKVALVALGEDAVTAFRTNADGKYTAALARYQAWADACEDSQPFAGTTIVKLVDPFDAMVAENKPIIPFGILLMVSGVALTSILVYRKKRHH